ncbi:deleted in primary ciliary dyskinesia homolog (mouse) [Nesidiocoris tenuis]|uniref:Protein DPCD n=1 Tax=Nesidiocoris tenuis TaxID=355587 RepID=A0ABN7BCE4_9HEMI|nr:deleted in primary ciliary dyskinesia homolog (mouse) [Nesidiocoris tenuis]
MTIADRGLVWLEKLKNAEKTCIIQEGKRKVHYRFNDGEEMAEEYNMATDIILRRAWKRKNTLKQGDQWEVELGDPEPTSLQSSDEIGLRESTNMPYVLKRMTKTNIEWRIRNLPYPIETYSVTASPSEKCITVRTTNKKYFKKLDIPELERANVLPKQENVSFAHNLNVLIISYKKPTEVLQIEQVVLTMVKSLKTITDPGQLPCNPS